MGESVGRYEGDTLVIDTIGFNDKTVVDRFGTPHREKLHVVERWRVIDQGLTLRVDIEVDDPDTFHMPWKTYQLLGRIARGFEFRDLCGEQREPLRLRHAAGSDAGFLSARHPRPRRGEGNTGRFRAGWNLG